LFPLHHSNDDDDDETMNEKLTFAFLKKNNDVESGSLSSHTSLWIQRISITKSGHELNFEAVFSV